MPLEKASSSSQTPPEIQDPEPQHNWGDLESQEIPLPQDLQRALQKRKTS
jgi:hypothetical protein